MPPSQPRPPIPWGQNLSAAFFGLSGSGGGLSGVVVVATKFRRVDAVLAGLQAGPIVNASTQLDISTTSGLAGGGVLMWSANAGRIAFSLQNASTTVSSGRQIWIWATGIM